MIYITLIVSLWQVIQASSVNFRSQHSRNISINPGSFYLIKIDAGKSISQMSVQQNISIAKVQKIYNNQQLKTFFDSSLFDVFIIETQQDFDCYMQIYYNSAWEQSCYFMYNTSATSMKLENFTTQKITNATIIIDNTYFPVYGAYFNDPLYLDIELNSEIIPDMTFYNWTFRVLIVGVILLINLIIWGIVIMYFYKKEIQKTDKQTAKTKKNEKVN